MKLPIALLSIILLSCSPSKKQENSSDKPLIVCTTGIISDVVKNIVGNEAEVQSIMGPGVDPHLYKATHGDLVKFQEADLIIYNGLHLEGKMGEVLEKLGRKKAVIAFSDGLDPSLLINNTDFQGAYDPHIWFDVALWNQALAEVTQKLITELDLSADSLNKHYQIYRQKLDSLDKAVGEAIESIPLDQRKLVTAHDAFGYYGKAYGIEVKGLQGISTLSEFGLKDVSSLVDYIVEHRIPSIYTETSVSEKSIEAVLVGVKAKGFDVSLGGSLYSDALGPSQTYEGTYIGMVDTNTKKIVQGLKIDLNKEQ